MSMATTATMSAIVDATFPSGSFIFRPGASSSDVEGRVVRFDNECVLIPEASPRSKLPQVLTKSYSLPLWKRRQQNDSDVEESPRQGRSSSPVDSRVVIKVPIPIFRRRSSRSPSRGRSVSMSPVMPRSLPSCLVHRSPSNTDPSAPPLSPGPRPSLPIYHRRKDELTVPLRDCCQACERITEECLKVGELWPEKFSKGARRRRSASLDQNDAPPRSSQALHIRTGSYNLTPSCGNGADDFPLPPSRFNCSTSTFSLTVDEVDKRRKSLDLNSVDTITPFLSNTSPDIGFHTSGSPYAAPNPRYPLSSRFHDRDISSNSAIPPNSTSDELLPDILDPRHRLRSSPIEEEDEAQLFPLPSPRRSPSGTPSPSPSPKVSPAPSPHGSTTCLPATVGPSANSSKESVVSKAGSSQESLLKASLSRKVSANGYLSAPAYTTSKPGVNNPLLIASSTPSSTLASKRSVSNPVRPTHSSDNSGRAPLPSKVSQSSSPTQASKPPVARLTTEPSPTDPSPSSSSRIPIPSTRPTAPVFASAKLDSLSFPPSSPIAMPSKSNTPNSPTTATFPTSPTSPSKTFAKRKLSFTAPFLKAGEVIRDASVDVLKGVSSISGGGLVGSP